MIFLISQTFLALLYLSYLTSSEGLHVFRPNNLRLFYSSYSLSEMVLTPWVSSTLKNIYNKNNVFTIYLTGKFLSILNYNKSLGGGIEALKYLFTVPGASSSVMNAQVPYSRYALHNGILLDSDYSLQENNSSCSDVAALKIAEKAYINALECASDANKANIQRLSELNIFGVSCTASLVTAFPKKGKFIRLIN